MRFFPVLVRCALLLSFGVAAVFGQSNFGSIRGKVTDPTGAAVVGAKVTVVDEGTNATTSLLTNEEGYYNAEALRPVLYTVSVEIAGFQKTTIQKVKVDTSKISTVDVELKIGNVAENVTVTDDAPLLQTYTGSVINTIDQRTIVDTPLNGRNTIELTLTLPGAAGSAGTEISGFNTNEALPGRELSINGGRIGSTQFLADGADTTSIALARSSVSFSPDTIQEFSVQQTNYSAQYARAGGAIIQQTTKSGTNEYRGNAFWFHRQKAFTASPFGAQRLAALNFDPRTPLRRQQLGATFGGPVSIPKIYNGKDRTFFFVSYEPTRQLESALTASTTRVPTDAEINGDFSQTMVYFRNAQGVVREEQMALLYNQFQRRGDGTLALRPNPNYNPAQPASAANPIYQFNNFPLFNPNDPNPARRGRVLVDANGQSYVNPVAQRVARELYPRPNILNAGEVRELLGANYVFYRGTEYKDDRYTVRLDHRLSDKHNLYGRYTHQPQFGDRFQRDPIQNGLISDKTDSRQTMVSWIGAFAPTMVNEFRANYVFGSFDRAFPSELQSRDLTSEYLNIGGAGAGAPNILGFGSARFFAGAAPFGVSDQQSGTGWGALGFNSPQDVGRNTEHSYSLNNDFTWSRGSQTWKMGFAASHLQLNQSALGSGSLAGGRFNFDRNQTQNQFCGSQPFPGNIVGCAGTAVGGDPFATFLLGVSSGLQVQTENLSNPYYYRWSNMGAYFQNDWKVTSTLTLNLGLRWQYQSPRWEKNNLQGQLNLSRLEPNPFVLGTDGQPLQAPVFEFAGVDGRSRFLVDQQWFDFEPRFGFAWAPQRFGGKMVVRGGYGITHGTLMGNDREPVPNIGSQTFGGHRQISYTLGINDISAPTNNPNCGLARCNDPGVPLQFGFNNAILQGDPSLFLVPASGVIRPSDLGGVRAGTTDIRQDVRYRGLSFIGDPTFKTPMIQVYSLQLQYQVMTNTVVTLGYQGNRGTRLQGPTYNVNPVNPFTGERPIPGYDGRFTNGSIYVLNPSNTASTYHAFTSEIERRFYNGLQFRVNYTWAKLIDDSSGGINFPVPNNSFNNATVDVALTRNQVAGGPTERSVSSLNVPHTINYLSFWEVPVGRGKKFLNTRGPVDWVLGGWQLSTLGRIRTGNPLSALLGVGNSVDSIVAGGALRPDLIPGVSLKNPEWTRENALFTPYVNARAFAFPEPGRFGNAGRNFDIYGPWIKTLDINLVKRFYPWQNERRYFEFRTEIFNVLNLRNDVITQGTGTSVFNAGAQTPLLNNVGGRLIPTGSTTNRFAALRDPGVWDAIVARSQGVPTDEAISRLPGPGTGGVGCPATNNPELATTFLGALSPACVARQLSLNGGFYRLDPNGVRPRLFQFALKFYF
jgi:hypothetical protein